MHFFTPILSINELWFRFYFQQHSSLLQCWPVYNYSQSTSTLILQDPAEVFFCYPLFKRTRTTFWDLLTDSWGTTPGSYPSGSVLMSRSLSLLLSLQATSIPVPLTVLLVVRSSHGNNCFHPICSHFPSWFCPFILHNSGFLNEQHFTICLGSLAEQNAPPTQF